MQRGLHWTEQQPSGEEPAGPPAGQQAEPPAAEPTARRRQRLIALTVLAPIGIVGGLGAVAWGEHAIRGDGGITTAPAPRAPTTTAVTAAPTDASAPTTTSAAPTTTTGPASAPRLAAAAAGHSAGSPQTPPPPPPPVVPGGPSVSLAQAADCIQVGDTNHVEADVSAPAGLGSVALLVLHGRDGTTFNGPMDFDGTNYADDVGPFNDYAEVQHVTWTVTVTDALGRAAQDNKQFVVSEDPCP